MYVRLWLVGILMGLLSCNPSTPQPRVDTYQASSGNSYHWTPSAFPIPVALHPRLPVKFATATVLAIESWNTAAGAEVFFVARPYEAFPMWFENGSMPYLGYVAVEAGPIGTDPTFHVARNGIAHVHLRTGLREWRGEIHSVHIMLSSDLADLDEAVRVAFHELGHALGLAHDADDEMSIMWFSATNHPDQTLQSADLDHVVQQLPR